MADRLILYCVRHAARLAQSFTMDDIELMKASYALDRSEVALLVNYLVDLGYARQQQQTLFHIAPLGYQYIEEGAGTIDSVQGFVAMWFNPDMADAFNGGFAKAITECGYAPFRIDLKEHNQKIDDEIIAEIRRSRFLVADFTGHRGGVYFEAGFAHGLGLPIIWTCKKSDIAELHFDIRQYNCIDWSSVEELCSRLSNRISALLGRGTVKH